jgi:hypothetical protein
MGKIAIDTAAREAPQFLKSMLEEQAAKQKSHDAQHISCRFGRSLSHFGPHVLSSAQEHVRNERISRESISYRDAELKPRLMRGLVLSN